jgi:small conductance mechanosensitive channel
MRVKYHRIITFQGVLLLALALQGSWAFAQDSAKGEDAPAPESGAIQPLSDKARAELDAMVAELAVERTAIAEIDRSIQSIDESMQPILPILQVRLAQSWAALMQRGLNFADEVLKKQELGYDAADYRQQAIDALSKYPAVGADVLQTLKKLIRPPDKGLSAADEARANSWTFALISARDRLYQLLLDSLNTSRALGVDVDEQQAELKRSLSERASSNSVWLALAVREVIGRKAGLAVMPTEPELQAKVAVAETQVSSLAASLDSAVGIMTSLEMDATSYQQQVIGATGEISTDIFDPQVLWSLIKKSLQKLVDLVVEDGPNLLLKLLIFAAIFFVFRKLANIVQRLIEAGLDRSQLQLSQLLRSMIVSISRNIVLIIGILLGLSQVGISLGPLLAGLGVAGFVIGFALQDSLSNFASGMMILSYRPFDVGDVVEAGGVFGKVSHMSLVNTTIMTFDNQTLVVPNNKIWGDVIKNVTSQRTRRVDLVFGISYSDDIPRTEALLREILAADERVLTDPEPMVRLNELADSSVNFIVRPWVKTEDYWDVYWDVTREVKLRFDEADVSIPFPQTDVHLKTEQAVGVQVQEDSSGHSA